MRDEPQESSDVAVIITLPSQRGEIGRAMYRHRLPSPPASVALVRRTRFTHCVVLHTPRDFGCTGRTAHALRALCASLVRHTSMPNGVFAPCA